VFARLTQKVQADRDAFQLKANEQFLGKRDMFGIRGRTVLTRNGLNKRRGDGGGKLPFGEEEAQTGLFNPGPGVLKGESAVSVQAHSLDARSFQLLCCQRKTSFQADDRACSRAMQVA
jgi:hypothetical protein